MLKNQPNQIVHCGLTNLDGSPFVGTATVYVTGDNGSPTLGATGSGLAVAATHGPCIYAPTQAETNYGVVTFEFSANNAVSEKQTFYPDLSVGGRQDINVGTVNGTAVTGNGSGGSPWGPN